MSPGTEHRTPGTSAEPCHHHIYHFPENAFKMVWIVPPLRSALYINCISLFHCAFWSICVVLRTSTFTTVHLDIALCGWEDFRTSIVLCNMASVRVYILSQKSHWITFLCAITCTVCSNLTFLCCTVWWSDILCCTAEPLSPVPCAWNGVWKLFTPPPPSIPSHNSFPFSPSSFYCSGFSLFVSFCYLTSCLKWLRLCS